MSNIITPKYKGSMKLFYVVVETIFNILSGNIGSFSALKAMYTSTYVNDLMGGLATARALPTTSKGMAQRGAARVDLENAAEKLRLKWQMLKNYIIQAFPADKHDWELREAGSEYYAEKISIWAGNQSMADAALTYIEENENALQKNNNMPANFMTAFADAATQYSQLLLAFTQANTTKNDMKKAKAAANNVLYEAIVTLSNDAAVIYKRDYENRRKYSYNYQLAVLKGGSSSFKGYVKVNGMPAEGISVGSTDGKYFGITNAKGYFKITKMQNGDYIFVFAKNGLVTLEKLVTLMPATSKTVRVEMVAS